MRTVSTEDVERFVDNDEVTLIDVRSPDAYNGWTLRGEPHGGHIPGARNLASEWAGYIDWLDIVGSKGIHPRDKVVLYGDDLKAVHRVARSFRKAGFDDVQTYPYFLQEWCADPGLPMDRLERFRHLVPPAWVHALTAGREPPGGGVGEAVVCHCHYRNEADYDEGHIPGAIPLDTLALESPETWNRREPDEMRAALERHGISNETTVVLYGRYAYPDPAEAFPGASAGQLAAMRCAFLMLYAGVEDVRVLNGGIRSWKAAGFNTTTEPSDPNPVDTFRAKLPGLPGIAVDTPEAKQILASDDGRLVSIRSRPEFEGRVSGYNYIEEKGRIPGAVFGNSGSDAYHMENYRNLDRTTLEYNQIADQWASAGITPGHRIAFYCGTGWRASEAFFNAWLMGWPRIAVYDGGWFEWTRDPGNPTDP